jgi:hypothetical protein
MSSFSWRCQYCSWAFQMSSDAVVAALAAADANQARHHVEHCPRCRKALKIPVDQLRHHAPINVPAATPAPIRSLSFQEDEKKMTDIPAPIPPVAPLVPAPQPEQPVIPPEPRAVPAPAIPSPAAPKPAVKKPVKKRVKKSVKRVVKKKPARKPGIKPAKKTAKKAAKKTVRKTSKKGGKKKSRR